MSLVLVLTALAGLAVPTAQAITAGGSIDVTSDSIYWGLSYSGGRPAVQLDLHASTANGTFVGVFGASRDRHIAPWAAAEVDSYLGQRFTLSDAWNAALTALSHNFVGGAQRTADDYQQISASLSYQDLWTAAVSAVPNEVRYDGSYRVGRYAAYVAETSIQWLMARGLFLTAGAGYYYMTASATQYERWGMAIRLPGSGYVYGNLGIAYQYRRWRLDVGYFLTQPRAATLFAYPTANRHAAATLSWEF